jgi:phosphoadenosine phosphosulfate reductase
MLKNHVIDLLHLIEGKDALTQLKIIANFFPEKTVFSTSLGLEDQVITHLIFAHNIPIEIFTLDTGRMFSETYETLDNTVRKYKKSIKVYFPDTLETEKLVNEKGMFSFYDSIENRKECCGIRKVKPLKRALQGHACWVTGIRAAQSANRQNMPQIEWDEANQIIKFHPLLHWSLDEIKDFIKQNFVPYNLLHDRGFPSIGCQPCTRAIQAGEDERAGRWWWEQESGKECGLHEVKKLNS